MPRLVCRIGKMPKTYRYSDVRLERRGFLSIFSFGVSDKTRRQELMERGQAVVVLPVDRERRLVYLIEQPRHSKAFTTTAAGTGAVKNLLRTGAIKTAFTAPAGRILTLECPAGMIDAGETPLQAAVRELEEETGLVASPRELKPVKKFFLSIGGCTETVTGFIADVNRKTIKNPACGDGDETIAVWEFGWDEAFRLARSRRIESASGLIMLQYLQLTESAGSRR